MWNRIGWFTFDKVAEKSVLKVEAAGASETLLSTYRTTWCHISKSVVFTCYHSENFKSQTFSSLRSTDMLQTTHRTLPSTAVITQYTKRQVPTTKVHHSYTEAYLNLKLVSSTPCYYKFKTKLLFVNRTSKGKLVPVLN
jgi:hypothetical protein